MNLKPTSSESLISTIIKKRRLTITTTNKYCNDLFFCSLSSELVLYFFLTLAALLTILNKHTFVVWDLYLADYQSANNCYKLKKKSVHSEKQENKSSDGVNQHNSTHSKGII